jgi:lysophospholipase L1-like esterase
MIPFLKLCGAALLSLTVAACTTTGIADYAPSTAGPFASEVNQFIASDRASRPDPCQVLFIGSSSIVFWKTLAGDMAPMSVINRGFGGAQISDITYWFDTVVSPYHPSIIVFYAGENDIAGGKTPEQVIADFEAFMVRKSETLGATPVYFISLKPSILRFDQIMLQSQVNEGIRVRAQSQEDLHYIDITGVMLDNGRPKALFLPDNLHMRPEGYALWARAVRSALRPDTEQKAKQCRKTLPH